MDDTHTDKLFLFEAPQQRAAERRAFLVIHPVHDTAGAIALAFCMSVYLFTSSLVFIEQDSATVGLRGWVLANSCVGLATGVWCVGVLALRGWTGPAWAPVSQTSLVLAIAHASAFVLAVIQKSTSNRATDIESGLRQEVSMVELVGSGVSMLVFSKLWYHSLLVSRMHELVGKVVRVPQDHDSLQDAVDAARGGDRIMLAPGEHKGPVKIDKNVEIVGEGSRDDVVVVCKGVEHAFSVFLTRRAKERGRVRRVRIANLTINHNGDDPEMANEVPLGAVAVFQGAVLVENCAVMSKQGWGVLAQGPHASVVVERCLVSHCLFSGVCGTREAKVVVTRSMLRDNGVHGLCVQHEAKAVMQRSVAQRNKRYGAAVVDTDSRLVLKHNDFQGNGVGRVYLQQNEKGHATLVLGPRAGVKDMFEVIQP